MRWHLLIGNLEEEAPFYMVIFERRPHFIVYWRVGWWSFIIHVQNYAGGWLEFHFMVQALPGGLVV